MLILKNFHEKKKKKIKWHCVQKKNDQGKYHTEALRLLTKLCPKKVNFSYFPK